MLISTFKHEFRQRAGVFITQDLILFRRPFELYDFTNDEVIATFEGNDVEAALDYDIGDGVTIRGIITAWKHIPVIVLNGGRGSSSSTDEYTHRGIPMFNSNGGSPGRADLPARFNARFGNETSFEKARTAFLEQHGEDDYESGITIDQNGFVTRYIHGSRSSVAISGKTGEHIVHNHPSHGWPIFSGADLVAVSLGGESSITASSTKAGRDAATAKYAGEYIFEKGAHFKAEAFIKAVKGAYLKGNDYNDAVSKWLRAHESKFGYKFTYIPAKAKSAAKGKTKATGKATVGPIPPPVDHGIQLSLFDDDNK